MTDTVIEVSFRGDSATVQTRPRVGAPLSRSVGIGAMAYSSATLDALISSSPLSDVFKATHRFFYPPPARYGTIAIALRVTGSERVGDRSGVQRDAWIVAADTPGGGTTYWIDKSTRTVLQYDTHEGPAVIAFRR